MSKTLIAATCLLFVFSCDNNSSSKLDNLTCEVNNNQRLDFTVVKTININVDTMLYNFPCYTTCSADSTDYFVGYDPENHHIDFFDLKQGQYSKSIQLSESGPNKIYDISSIYVHNMDSIFISQSGYFKIYLANKNGDKINEWDFFDISLPDSVLKRNDITGSFGLGSYDKYGIHMKYFSKEHLLIADIRITPKSDDNEFPSYYNSPLLAKFDVKNRTISEYIGVYPSEYHEDQIPHDFFFSAAYKSVDSLIISFNSSSKLFYKKGNDQGLVCAPSSFFNDNLITLYDENNGGTVPDFWKEKKLNPQYVNLLYDKYRDRYYRVFKHQLPEIDDMGYVPDKLQSKWSMIILDGELSVLGEVTFDKEIYDFMNIHILPSGILVSKNNENNQYFDEDKLMFDLISITL